MTEEFCFNNTYNMEEGDNNNKKRRRRYHLEKTFPPRPLSNYQ
jgi:hypothetical protein